MIDVIKLADGWLPLRCDKERQAYSIHGEADNLDVWQDFASELYVAGIVLHSKVLFTLANRIKAEDL